MRTQPTKRSVILSATLLLAALTACSGDPEPIIEPSPPASSPTDSPTPTTTPSEAEPESAKAFIRRWQDEALAMQLSGDTSRYRAMTKGCQDCDAFANQVDDIYSGDGAIEIASAKVFRVEQAGVSGGTQIFEFEVVSSPTVVRDSAGLVTQRLDGGRVRFQANLERERGDWHVVRISELV